MHSRPRTAGASPRAGSAQDRAALMQALYAELDTDSLDALPSIALSQRPATAEAAPVDVDAQDTLRSLAFEDGTRIAKDRALQREGVSRALALYTELSRMLQGQVRSFDTADALTAAARASFGRIRSALGDEELETLSARLVSYGEQACRVSRFAVEDGRFDDARAQHGLAAWAYLKAGDRQGGRIAEELRCLVEGSAAATQLFAELQVLEREPCASFEAADAAALAVRVHLRGMTNEERRALNRRVRTRLVAVGRAALTRARADCFAEEHATARGAANLTRWCFRHGGAELDDQNNAKEAAHLVEGTIAADRLVRALADARLGAAERHIAAARRHLKKITPDDRERQMRLMGARLIEARDRGCDEAERALANYSLAPATRSHGVAHWVVQQSTGGGREAAKRTRRIGDTIDNVRRQLAIALLLRVHHLLLGPDSCIDALPATGVTGAHGFRPPTDDGPRWNGERLPDFARADRLLQATDEYLHSVSDASLRLFSVPCLLLEIAELATVRGASALDGEQVRPARRWYEIAHWCLARCGRQGLAAAVALNFSALQRGVGAAMLAAAQALEREQYRAWARHVRPPSAPRDVDGLPTNGPPALVEAGEPFAFVLDSRVLPPAPGTSWTAELPSSPLLRVACDVRPHPREPAEAVVVSLLILPAEEPASLAPYGVVELRLLCDGAPINNAAPFSLTLLPAQRHRLPAAFRVTDSLGRALPTAQITITRTADADPALAALDDGASSSLLSPVQLLARRERQMAARVELRPGQALPDSLPDGEYAVHVSCAGAYSTASARYVRIASCWRELEGSPAAEVLVAPDSGSPGSTTAAAEDDVEPAAVTALHAVLRYRKLGQRDPGLRLCVVSSGAGGGGEDEGVVMHDLSTDEEAVHVATVACGPGMAYAFAARADVAAVSPGCGAVAELYADGALVALLHHPCRPGKPWWQLFRCDSTAVPAFPDCVVGELDDAPPEAPQGRHAPDRDRRGSANGPPQVLSLEDDDFQPEEDEDEDEPEELRDEDEQPGREEDEDEDEQPEDEPELVPAAGKACPPTSAPPSRPGSAAHPTTPRTRRWRQLYELEARTNDKRLLAAVRVEGGLAAGVLLKRTRSKLEFDHERNALMRLGERAGSRVARLVTYHPADGSDGNDCLVLERLGRSLPEIIADVERMPAQDRFAMRLQLARELAAVLDFLLGHGFVSCQLRLANVRESLTFRQMGVLRLKLADTSRGEFVPPRGRPAWFGGPLRQPAGTFWQCCPPLVAQAAMGRIRQSAAWLDPRGEVFCLGLCLAELFADPHEPLFESDDRAKATWSSDFGPYLPAARTRCSGHPGLQKLVRKMVAREERLRPDVGAVVGALSALIDGSPGSGSRRRVKRKKPRARSPPPAAAAAAAAAVLDGGDSIESEGSNVGQEVLSSP